MAEFDTAVVIADTRYADPEPRFLAHGLIGGRLSALVFTPIDHDIRVIRFRKANRV